MEGAVIVDDTEDGVAIENIAASQGAIDGVGPAVKVVAGGRRGDGALDVEATGRVDVEVDDFGCGLAVIGGGGRGNGTVAVGLVDDLDLAGLPHRVERGNNRVVIDVAGNGVERRLGRGLGTVTRIVEDVVPAQELIAIANGGDGRKQVRVGPQDIGPVLDGRRSTAQVVVQDEATMGFPDGVERLECTVGNLAVIVHNFPDIDINAHVGDIVPAQTIEITSVIARARQIEAGLRVPACDVIAEHVVVVGVAQALVVIGNDNIVTSVAVDVGSAAMGVIGHELKGTVTDRCPLGVEVGVLMAKDRMGRGGHDLLARLELMAGVVLGGRCQRVPPDEAVVLELEAIRSGPVTALVRRVGNRPLEVIGHEGIRHATRNVQAIGQRFLVVVEADDGSRVPVPTDDTPSVGVAFEGRAVLAVQRDDTRIVVIAEGHIVITDLEVTEGMTTIKLLDAPAGSHVVDVGGVHPLLDDCLDAGIGDDVAHAECELHEAIRLAKHVGAICRLAHLPGRCSLNIGNRPTGDVHGGHGRLVEELLETRRVGVNKQVAQINIDKAGVVAIGVLKPGRQRRRMQARSGLHARGHVDDGAGTKHFLPGHVGTGLGHVDALGSGSLDVIDAKQQRAGRIGGALVLGLVDEVAPPSGIVAGEATADVLGLPYIGLLADVVLGIVADATEARRIAVHEVGGGAPPVGIVGGDVDPGTENALMRLEAGIGEVVVLVEGELLERRVTTKHVLNARGVGEVEARRVEFLEGLEVAGDELEGPSAGIAIRRGARNIRIVITGRVEIPDILAFICQVQIVRTNIFFSVAVVLGPAIPKIETISRICVGNDYRAVESRQREITNIEVVASSVRQVLACADIMQGVIRAVRIRPHLGDAPEGLVRLRVFRQAIVPKRREVVGIAVVPVPNAIDTILKHIPHGIGLSLEGIGRKPTGHIGGSKFATGNDRLDLGRVDNALPRQIGRSAGHGLLAIDAA